MKRLSRLFLAACLIAPVTPALADTYRLGVDGLACPFCAYGIEKQLSRLEGVESVETDIESGTVTVTTPDGKQLERKQLEQAVERAGFTLRTLVTEPAP